MTPYVVGNCPGGINGCYDAAGRQIQVDPYRLEYDAEGRVTAVYATVSGETGWATYGYDGQGRRVKKTRYGQTQSTYFVYNAQGELVMEYGGATSASTDYYTTDHLGSTRMVTNGSGAVVRRYDYYPFGEGMPAGANGRSCEYFGGGTNDGRTVRFTGKERDAETGLDYFASRYYSGAQGRFTSPDRPLVDQSARDPQSWNLYSYVRNNPLRFTDPTGMACVAGRHDETGDACFEVTKTEGTNWFTRFLGKVGSVFQGAADEGANTFIGFANTIDSMRQATSGGPDLRQPLRVPGNDYEFVGGMYAMAFGMMGNPGSTGARIIGDVGFSTRAVAQAAKEIEGGATSLRVASKSDAEEIFLRLFQGHGYRNTTGMDAVGAKQMFGNKAGTYHWDTTAGHGPGNPHGTGAHLPYSDFHNPNLLRSAELIWRSQ